MPTWRIAGVQMDCRLGAKEDNLNAIRGHLEKAARMDAQLVVFPECILTGYCFESKEEALPFAETLPGPTTEILARDCARLGTWAAVGLLEHRPEDDALFNACVLVGPEGQTAVYRKIHLPFLGVDRFTTPGDRPFAVHELGANPGPANSHPSQATGPGGSSLKVGMTICYDGSFPEAARCLMLQGADLVVLPTNWPTGATSTVKHLIQARALENWIYFLAVNRVGTERGFRFIGQSRAVDVNGDLLAAASEDREEILLADIDPEKARRKRIVHIPGKYELDRVGHRRPEMYGPITDNRS